MTVLHVSNYSPAQLLFGITTMGGSSAIAAALFTSVNPIGGAIFGVSTFLSDRLIHWIIDHNQCCPQNVILRTAKFAIALICGIALSICITTYAGYPLTATTGVTLAITSIITAVGSLLTMGSCLCSSLVVTGIAMAFNPDDHSVRV